MKTFWLPVILSVAIVVLAARAPAQTVVPSPLSQSGVLVVCVDTACFPQPVTVLLPPVPSSLNVLSQRPGQTCSLNQAPADAVLAPERTHLVRVFHNGTESETFGFLVIGDGIRLLDHDEAGWVHVLGSRPTPASARIAVKRGSGSKVGGVLYIRDGSNETYGIALVAPTIPEYVEQTYGSGLLSVGILGTHQSGFSLQATLPPSGYRSALLCYWAAGGGSCGAGVQCSPDLADPLRPRLAFRLNANVQNTQAFLSIVYEADEHATIFAKAPPFEQQWGIGGSLPLP